MHNVSRFEIDPISFEKDGGWAYQHYQVRVCFNDPSDFWAASNWCIINIKPNYFDSWPFIYFKNEQDLTMLFLYLDI